MSVRGDITEKGSAMSDKMVHAIEELDNALTLSGKGNLPPQFLANAKKKAAEKSGGSGSDGDPLTLFKSGKLAAKKAASEFSDEQLSSAISWLKSSAQSDKSNFADNKDLVVLQAEQKRRKDGGSGKSEGKEKFDPAKVFGKK